MTRRTLVAGLTTVALLAGLLRAGQPALAADEPASPADRSAVVSAWQLGGGKVRAAAEIALVGSDADVRAFLDGGMRAAQRLDERDAITGVLADGGPALRAAAQRALDADTAGDSGALATFLDGGWQAPSDVDARVRVNQLMAAGGDQVKQAAQRALDSNDPQVLRDFLDSGWQLQWATDQRLRINQAMATGGPEVDAAAQKALDAGTPEAFEEFLDYGWAVATARDQETATLSDLLAQAQASGALAAQETQRATEEADRAEQAAEAAKRSAAEAAAATERARNDTAEAAAQAKRAAAAAEKAAECAQTAVRAAASASSAARAAAAAAGRAAAAASRAEQAATRAYKAAADAAGDKSKAAAARSAAEQASAIARSSRDFANTADQAGKAIQAGLDAVNAAKSAATHAKEAADANDDAVRNANAAGADAKEAVAAAQRARANAERALRAANAAQHYLQVAIQAAFAARDAANRAAADAEAAAAAAIDAANHAGEAAEAARRATEAAQAATVAAQAAVDTSNQALTIYQAARDADAERIAVARDEGVEAAQSARVEYDKQQAAARWDAGQAAQRDAETNRLIAEAQNPATDPATVVRDGRKIALALSTGPGVWSRQAALGALSGTDEQVVLYVRTGIGGAAAQDDRASVMDLTVSDNSGLAAAATAALAGTDAQVSEFLRTQNYPGRATQDRLKVNQVLAAARNSGDSYLAQKAQEALDNGTAAALRAFLDTGQFTAAAVGRRVQVNQILASPDSGPELKAAAQVALDGPDPALDEFLRNGRYLAAERDEATAAHLAVVGGLLQQINEVATTAVQNAQEAQAQAARARGEAAAAADWANKAAQSAQQAAAYAQQARAYADQAAASVQKAAAAVQTAKNAATRANASARSAIRSAAWAVASQQMAVNAAINANGAAKQAYDSAIAAGKDAEAAAAAAQQAYDAYKSAQGLEIAKCNTEYASGPAPDLEKLLGSEPGEWYRNCVANVIADPAELARRAYINASFCDIYPSGSAAQQNCLHSVLDPTFRGMQPLIFMVQVMQGMVAMLAPVGIVAAAGCIATVVCGAALGTLLTIGDVGLSLYKYINGDVSLSDTLLHLGKVTLETLLLVGIGKALSAGFKALKGLYVAFRAAKQAEAELEVVNLARLRLNGLVSCLRPGHSFAAGTPVLMAGGDRRPIDKLVPGDRVLATDPVTGRTAAKPVTNVWRHTDTDLTDVGVTGPGGDGVVHTTATHPFWSASSRSWVPASRLIPGTGLAAPPGGGAATVEAVRPHRGSQTMYDLTVADLHSYYVGAGRASVLVHNSTEECPLVLGIKRYGEDLAGKIKGFTINNPALDEVVGNVNGVPITLWMQEVNKELSANGHIAVAMDGWEGLGAGSIEEAKAAFLLAVRNGSGTSWRATEWEMYRISFYCRIGNLEWRNVKFYINGERVDLPEPIWNLDPAKIRFP